MTLKLIIDTDCGVDDALAILLALFSKDVEIVAITCCCGNVALDKVWHNVCRVLQYFEAIHIPVYVGCDRPLINPLMPDADFHGEDGLGNVPLPRDEEVKPRAEHGAAALVEYAKKFPNELTLVALGPLTNLAVAQRLDQNFSKNLKKLYFMGGNLKGIGNITVSAEFNFHIDPEAAHVVLNEFVCPIECVPWEPCYNKALPKSTYQELISLGTKRSDFMKDVTAHTAEWMMKVNDMATGYFPCDLYAMAYVLHPEVAERREKWHSTVELNGANTRGQMIVDSNFRTKTTPNVEFVVEFSLTKLVEVIIKMLKD